MSKECKVGNMQNNQTNENIQKNKINVFSNFIKFSIFDIFTLFESSLNFHFVLKCSKFACPFLGNRDVTKNATAKIDPSKLGSICSRPGSHFEVIHFFKLYYTHIMHTYIYIYIMYLYVYSHISTWSLPQKTPF